MNQASVTASGDINKLMRWLDARSTSYLGWAWNADFSTPTGYGKGYPARLRSLR